MKEPRKIPLTDGPRSKEVSKIPLQLYPEPISDDVWDRFDTPHGPIIFAKKNENNLENNSQSVQELGTDQTN